MAATKSRFHPTVVAAAWVSFLTDFSSEMIYPLLPVFLTMPIAAGGLGLGADFVGVLEGAAETTASLLKLVSGWLSDRMGRRRPLVVFGYTISSISRPLVALTAAGWQVLALRISDRVGKGLRSAPRDALIADVVPPESRGRAFGYQRAMDHAGAVVGPLMATALLYAAHLHLRTVFALSAVPAVLAIIAVSGFVRDAPGLKSSASRPPLSPRAWAQLDRRLLLLMGILALFTLGNSSDAFLLLRAKDIGIAPFLLPLLWVALHAVKSLTSTPAGTLSDRIGRRRMIVGGWLLYALVYAGFAFAGGILQIWGLFLVYGVFFGLTEGAEKALVSELCLPEERGAAFGLYAFTIGIVALPANVIMGELYKHLGVHVAFLWGAGLALIAGLLLAAAPFGRPRSA